MHQKEQRDGQDKDSIKKMGKIKKQLIDDKYNTIFWPLFCPCISVLYPFKTSKY
jgi:hypothetical protein